VQPDANAGRAQHVDRRVCNAPHQGCRSLAGYAAQDRGHHADQRARPRYGNRPGLHRNPGLAGRRILTTIELDPGAQEMARLNPWSQELFNNPKITQLMGDAYEVVPTFEDESFGRIIHDPPTFRLETSIQASSTANSTAS